MPVTLGDALRNVARDHAGQPVLIGDGGIHSYAQLDEAADALAAAMLNDGIGRGDHVGIWMPTGFTFLAIFCATARIGAVAVPVNTRYREEEVRHVLTKAGVRILFAQAHMWRTDSWQTLCAIAPDLATTGLPTPDLPDLHHIVLIAGAPNPAAKEFDSYLADDRNAPAVRFPTVEESDRLLICFTSGSTGKPKGVVHTHRVLRHCRRLAAIQGLAPNERPLANWPLHHAGGLFLLALPSLLAGATLVAIDQWSGREAIRLIEAYRVTVLGGIPTHYLDIIDDPDVGAHDLSSLRYCYMGGANVARDTFDRIVDVLGISALPSTYGLTENTVSATFNLPGDTPDQCSRNIAPLVADCEVRIVDPDDGREMPLGEQGEIQFRGATVMAGYHDDPDATRAAITFEGWLRTGDLGRIHANGYLQPVGRLKEMLKVGGSNVAPAEVEAVLVEHPAVRNAVVVGVPDARLTEVAYAYVERRPGVAGEPADIIAHCRARIADYKVPRYVALVDTFPRLSTGKIDRAGLAAAARSETQYVHNQEH